MNAALEFESSRIEDQYIDYRAKLLDDSRRRSVLLHMVAITVMQIAYVVVYPCSFKALSLRATSKPWPELPDIIEGVTPVTTLLLLTQAVVVVAISGTRFKDMVRLLPCQNHFAVLACTRQEYRSLLTTFNIVEQRTATWVHLVFLLHSYE